MIKKQLLVAVVLSMVLAIGLDSEAFGTEANDSPPNIVLIIGDDQAWSDFGFMGHTEIKTPQLDQLAKQSLTFTRGYVPTSLCRPSLASIITGLYPRQHKITGNDPAIPRPVPGRSRRQREIEQAKNRALREKLIGKIDSLPTLPKLLKKKGYVSLQTGKWWEGNFKRGGFTHGMTHGDPKRGGRHGDEGLKIGRNGLEPIFDFVRDHREQPFFVWYAPFLPHTPHNPPPQLLAKYQKKGRPLALAKYYAMCEWFDQTCGQLLDFLDEENLSDNTVVIFVTDNGWIQRTASSTVPTGWRRQFAPRSKQSPYDGGIRTPITIRWPKQINAKMDNSTLVSSIDLAPTILAACGIAAPDTMSGLNLLSGKRAAQQRNAVFGEIYAHDIADLDRPDKSLLYQWLVSGDHKLITAHQGRVGRYKIVHGDLTRAPELYNITKDPFEKSIIHDPALLRRLQQQTHEFVLQIK